MSCHVKCVMLCYITMCHNMLCYITGVMLYYNIVMLCYITYVVSCYNICYITCVILWHVIEHMSGHVTTYVI